MLIKLNVTVRPFLNWYTGFTCNLFNFANIWTPVPLTEVFRISFILNWMTISRLWDYITQHFKFLQSNNYLKCLCSVVLNFVKQLFGTFNFWLFRTLYQGFYFHRETFQNFKLSTVFQLYHYQLTFWFTSIIVQIVNCWNKAVPEV